MSDLALPSDAFSHGQIRSKLWLAENFKMWSMLHLDLNESYGLNWYGSWVGIGPFLLLENTPLRINKVELFDLNVNHLKTSTRVLDFWRCQSIEIKTTSMDVNDHRPVPQLNQIFINSACEHMDRDMWLSNIPAASHVILQSTNMPHAEHTNCSASLGEFVTKYEPAVQVLDRLQIDFNYPDKQFSRFMLFGIKK